MTRQTDNDESRVGGYQSPEKTGQEKPYIA